MSCLFIKKPDSIKIDVFVDSFVKPHLGELSPNEAGQKGLWCFSADACFILPEEVLQIYNKLRELNDSHTSAQTNRP